MWFFFFFVRMERSLDLSHDLRSLEPFRSSEREAGSKTEMGLAASWKVTQGYHARVSGRLRTEYYGEETGYVCFKQS